MNPEIKAAIEREAERYCNKPDKNGEYPLDTEGCKIDFTVGAEFGYKLGEQKLNTAIKALEYVVKGCPTEHPECTCVKNTAIMALKDLKK